MTLENKSIARRLYQEVWNERKLDVVDELISPSHALHEPNASDSLVGPQAYKRTVTVFLTGIPDLRFKVQDMISENDKLAVSWVISGTQQGDFYDVPATNKKITVEGVTIHQIDGGKILDSYVTWDTLSVMRRLGAVPSQTLGAAGGAYGS
jgi:steroid delta-isomerase-like uncharacterized protein